MDFSHIILPFLADNFEIWILCFVFHRFCRITSPWLNSRTKTRSAMKKLFSIKLVLWSEKLPQNPSFCTTQYQGDETQKSSLFCFCYLSKPRKKIMKRKTVKIYKKFASVNLWSPHTCNELRESSAKIDLLDWWHQKVSASGSRISILKHLTLNQSNPEKISSF